MSQTSAQLISGSSAQNPTFGATTVTSLNGGQLAGMRNRIINGDMRIDQRNAGGSVTVNSPFYTLDRWYNTTSVVNKYSVQQSSVAPAGFTNSALVTSLSTYSVLASDYLAFIQFVEGFNASDFGWGTAEAQSATLSFRVRSSLTGTFTVAIRSSSDDAAYPATYTINAANTWETKTITIPGPTSGTFGTGNGRAFGIWFSLGLGSNFNATANTWGSGNALTVAGSTSVVGTSGATFYITGIQLEPGTVATPFERRSYGQELALCQRYFYSNNGNIWDNYTWFPNSTIGNNYGMRGVVFPVLMRTAATVVAFNEAGVANRFSINRAGANVAGYLTNTTGFALLNGTGGNVTVTELTFSYTASAEL